MSDYSVKICAKGSTSSTKTYFTGIFSSDIDNNVFQANYANSTVNLLDKTLVNTFNVSKQILNSFNLNFTNKKNLTVQQIYVSSDKGDLILVTPTKITLTNDGNYNCTINYIDNKGNAGSTGNFLADVYIADVYIADSNKNNTENKESILIDVILPLLAFQLGKFLIKQIRE